ncbi:CTGF factor, partial [Sylvia atricapilla]|nr:CTGF factor [Sylvia atricapilla]
AHEGATCDLLGKIYLREESFQPTYKLQCICMDGAIGCIPLCSDDLRLLSPKCLNPRRVKFHNKCCEERVCEDSSEENCVGAAMAVFREDPAHKLELKSLQENCLVQTTEWSMCSQSCGMGISAHVANNNPQCRLEKETRLCMIRPCDFSMEKNKKGKKCVRTPDQCQSLYFEFSGCISTCSYRPRFCGNCLDGRCCTPFLTSTMDVEFRCPEGDFFQRKMMFIRMCSCHYDCPQENNIFLAMYHHRMFGDHV